MIAIMGVVVCLVVNLIIAIRLREVEDRMSDLRRKQDLLQKDIFVQGRKLCMLEDKFLSHHKDESIHSRSYDKPEDEVQ